ncbi:hypothetical protein KRX56_04075 [Dermabacteraceae bacterium TAE3-ERU27]|nr:hypothetical protein [Dermabacteraceae bacterium TAE3-ERU27]
MIRKKKFFAAVAYLLLTACSVAGGTPGDGRYVPDAPAKSPTGTAAGAAVKAEKVTTANPSSPAVSPAASAQEATDSGLSTTNDSAGIEQAKRAREFSHLFWSDFYARAGSGDRAGAERFFAPECVNCRDFSAKLFSHGGVFPSGAQLSLKFADGPVYALPGGGYRVEGKSVLSVSGSQLLFGYALVLSPSAESWTITDMAVWEEK